MSSCVSSKSIYYGKIIEKKYKVGNFNTVNFSGPAELIITQGKTTSLVVKAYSKFQEYVKVNEKGRKLNISFDKNLTDYETLSLNPVQYILTVDKLECLKLSGNAKAEIRDLKQYEIRFIQEDHSSINLYNLNVENLMLMNDGIHNITGSNIIIDTLDLSVLSKGSIGLNSIKGNFVNAVINSSGDISLGGRVDLVDILSMKKGEFMAENLIADKVNILIKNTGNAYVNAKLNIKAKITGDGNLYYTGSPKAIIYEGNYNKVIEIINKVPVSSIKEKMIRKNSEVKNVANKALVRTVIVENT